MKRRSILGIGCATGLAALIARAPSNRAAAQVSSLPLVAFLSLLPQAVLRDQLSAFFRGLATQGFVPDTSVSLVYRWADGDASRLLPLARELVGLRPSVIVAGGGNVAAAAAREATSTIPIVFTAVRDPVKAGLVQSFGRPGGNATGVSILAEELDTKRLELLQELAPSTAPAGVLLNPQNPSAALQRAIVGSARPLGRPVVIVEAAGEAEIETAFARLVALGATGLVVASDPYFTSQRARIVTLAAQNRLPAIYQWRQFVEEGGLASYGPSFGEAYRESGVMAGRILRGERPADLPVLQPSKFQLVISRRVAQELGLVVPPILLASADEVID